MPMFLLMIPLLVTLVAAPALVSAKQGSDDFDDNDEDTYLEVEADVFADTTIVKVEISDKKTVFTTEANTREEIVDVVVSKFGLTKSEVENVLDLEIENRDSRPKDRGKINKYIKHEKSKDVTATTTVNSINETKLSELRARIVELQSMLDRIIALMRGN